MFILLPAAESSPSKIRILPYKMWKQKKIDEAKSVVEEFKRDIRRSTHVRNEIDEEEVAVKRRKLSQAEINMGVAKELTANDYFVLYVSPQFKDDTDALQQAAKHLSAKDVAEILNGYQKTIQSAGNNLNTGGQAPGAPELLRTNEESSLKTHAN